MRTSTPSYVVELLLRVDDQQNSFLEQANSEILRLSAENTKHPIARSLGEVASGASQSTGVTAVGEEAVAVP